MNSNQLQISRQVAINSTISFKGCKSENMTENQQIMMELTQVKVQSQKYQEICPIYQVAFTVLNCGRHEER